MRHKSHSLRVVIVWRSTILQEQTFTQTSTPVVTVGESDKNLFGVTAPGLPDTFEMFERGEDGYTVRFTDRVDGTFGLGDEDWTLAEIVDNERAWKADKVRTKKEGAAHLYELELEIGDWGRIRLGDVHVFFQLIEQKEAVAGRGLASIEMPVVAMVLLAGFLHAVVLLTAFWAFEVDPSLEKMNIPDQFVEVMVDDVEDPPEPKEEEVASEDTSGKRAGGEEGKVGVPDSDIPDSKVPKDDGKMVEKIEDPTNVGVLEALSTQTLGGGAVAQLMNDSDGVSSRIDLAMGGPDGELELGRGAGGLGVRGLGDGGGDKGHGRMISFGSVDTGGGQGTGAKIAPKKRAEAPRSHFRREAPKVGDFCEPSDIRRVVSQKANAIKYCYEKQLQSRPELQGKIVAQWKVGLDGKVIDATIASSTMGSRSVESCIERVISRLNFNRPDGGICIINYPFVFTGVQ